MNDNPSIIDCGGIVFITRPFPPGPGTTLIPSEKEQVRIGVVVELRASFDNEYFAVAVSNWIRPGHDNPTREAWDEKVREILLHVWEEMKNRDIVTGSMPDIIQGHPLDMLPS